METAPGVFDDAWPLNAAQDIIGHLEGTGIIVLGGDVVRRDRDRITYTYDSWHYDPKGEDETEEAAESYIKALDYLRRYPDPQDGSLLYTLVLRTSTEQPTKPEPPGSAGSSSTI